MVPPRGNRPAAKSRARLGLATALISIFGYIACAARQRKDEPLVRDLKFSGNHALSSRQIEKKILTAQTGWWPFAAKKYFDPIAWASDLQRVVRLYISDGFYQAAVRDQVTPTAHDGVALAVTIREGQPTLVGQLSIAGLDAIPAETRKRVSHSLPLREGAVFTESAWAATKAEIIKRLRSLGYEQAAMVGEALVGVQTQRATLTVVVLPGLAYRFGGIDVRPEPGSRVAPFLVWEQVRLAIPEGQLFNDEALDEAQRRVIGMGVFSTVRVTTGAPDAATGQIPVLVDMHESPFRTLRLGGGAHIDQVRNEARLIGEWTNRDFLGGLRRLTLHAEAGWAFLPNFYAVATNESSEGPRSGPVADLSATLEQPRFLGRPSLRLKSGLEVERTLEQAYDDVSARLINGVIWQIRSRLSIFPSYHLEGDFLNGAPINSAASSPLTLGCETTSDHCFVWLSYLEEQLTWDHRDNPLEPREGFYFGLSLQEGGGPLAGDFSYLRALPDVRGYLSFGEHEKLTFAARLRVGELWPTSGNPNDSAVVTRFYAGGSNSMRGFGDRRLSPLLEVPAPGTNPPVQITIPIGGDGLIDGSFEARYSLGDSLRLAAFVDYGQVTTGLVSAGDFFHVLWAAGVGLRYLTPIGPIRLDVARRLPFGRQPPLYMQNAATGAIEQVPSYAVDDGCFGLFSSHPSTPVADGSCVLQISIGEAF